MKKIFSSIIFASSLLILVACGNQEKQESSNDSQQESSISSVVPSSSSQESFSSEELISSSEIIESTSESSLFSLSSIEDTSSIEESSSSLSSSQSISSSEKSSSSSSSSSSQTFVNNELSTKSGLVIKFKDTGASIDTITFKNKQIAKDGFVVGRCANRIAGAKFTLNGTTYNVSKNDGQNSLHGGVGSGMNSWRGPFATKAWTKVDQTASSIIYTIHSADIENGYPGNMDMTVKYTLSQDGELAIEYTATSDRDTLCNPTNHLFMALNGETNRYYPNINLQIDADSYTPLTNQIPTGEIKSVEGTQFDYRTEKAFDGSKNYDDNYALNGTGYRKVATMTGTSLGVKVEVFTDRPGLQLYKDGSGSICLETQMFPDAINQENFESPILRAGEEFYSKTAYCFTSVE